MLLMLPVSRVVCRTSLVCMLSRTLASFCLSALPLFPPNPPFHVSGVLSTSVSVGCLYQHLQGLHCACILKSFNRVLLILLISLGRHVAVLSFWLSVEMHGQFFFFLEHSPQSVLLCSHPLPLPSSRVFLRQVPCHCQSASAGLPALTRFKLFMLLKIAAAVAHRIFSSCYHFSLRFEIMLMHCCFLEYSSYQISLPCSLPPVLFAHARKPL